MTDTIQKDSKGMDNALKLSAGILRRALVFALVTVMLLSQGMTVEARNRASSYLELATGISNIISPLSPLGVDYTATEVQAYANAERTGLFRKKRRKSPHCLWPMSAQ
jgi:hypothetical protein